MSCLENIISVRDVCGDSSSTSLSGLDIMDAPEISTKNLAKIANEDYISGYNLAKKKVEQAAILFRNDTMSVMAQNKVLPNIVTKKYEAAAFKNTIQYPALATERGLTLYKNRAFRSEMRKTVIHKVYIYPSNSAEGVELKIYDDYTGGVVSTYNVDLVANEVNEFPVEYEVKGTYARVLLDGTNVGVYGSYLTCFTGCNGTKPNDCGYVKGWHDGREIASKEGFGINIEFSCECDYDQFICGLSKTYIGEIVWLKSRVLLMEEHLRGNRLNNWMVYGRDEMKDYMVDVENQYRAKWNGFVEALPNILKSFKDNCFQCNGIRFVTNI